MKSVKKLPEDFLGVHELSALENETLKGGASQVEEPCKKKKKCDEEDDEIVAV